MSKFKKGDIVRLVNDCHESCCGVKKGELFAYGKQIGKAAEVWTPAVWSPISGPGKRHNLLFWENDLELAEDGKAAL